MSEENHNYREKSRRQKQIYLFYFGSNPHDSTGLSAESEYSPREIAEFMTVLKTRQVKWTNISASGKNFEMVNK